MKVKIRFLEPYDGNPANSIRMCKNAQDAASLVADGIAEYCNDDDSADRQVSQDAIVAEVRRQLKLDTKRGGSPFPFAGTYAEPGFGPQDPKKFWLGDIPTGSDFGSTVDFLKAVTTEGKGEDGGKLRQKDIAGDDQSTGGYLVPEAMASFVFQTMLEDSPFMSKCTLLPMTGSSLKVPYVYDADHSTDGIHGGHAPHGIGEGAALTDISPTFGSCELTLKKIGGRCRVSSEVLEDSANAMSVLLPKLFADKLGWEMTRQFISGTGSGECLGLMKSAALVTQGKEVDQDADTIVTENIVRMWSRLLPSAQRKAVWLANLDTLPQLLTMTVVVGTGGSYVWLVGGDRNNAGLANAAPLTMLGRPIYLLEQMSTVGDLGDILVFNPEAYAIGRKPGSPLRIEVSEAARFENDQICYRALTRLDGQLLQSTAITPASGSANTLSNVVTLIARD